MARNKIVSIIANIAVGLALLTPVLALAQTGNPIEDGMKQVKDQFSTTGQVTKSQNLSQLISNVVKLILSVALAIAILFVIIGGYQYITSAGNEEKSTKGRQTLTNAIIGIIIIIFSYMIVTVIDRTLSK